MKAAEAVGKGSGKKYKEEGRKRANVGGGKMPEWTV